jgi:hypothetical protein
MHARKTVNPAIQALLPKKFVKFQLDFSKPYQDLAREVRMATQALGAP